MGTEISKALSQRLGWHIYDKEIVGFIASDKNVRVRLVEELDEKSQGLIEDTVRRLLEMVEGGGFGVEEYHEALIRSLVYLATRGNAILIGRGANFVVRSQSGLHLRLVASPEVRMERLCNRWGLSPREARLRMEQTDRERTEFIRRHYKGDPDDPRNYDLVLNTDRLNPAQAASTVLSLF